MKENPFLEAAKRLNAHRYHHLYSFSCNAIELTGGEHLRRLYEHEMSARNGKPLSIAQVQKGAGVKPGQASYLANLDIIRSFRVLMLCMMAAAYEDL